MNPFRNLTIALFLFSFVGVSAAHDQDGKFAVKGAGATRCAHFVRQVEEKTKEVYAYGGWIEGYLTAVDAYQKDTFDLAPWQNTTLLVLALKEHCRKHPELTFAKAVRQMVRTLYPQRLTTFSRLVEARNGDKAVRVYEAVVRRVQRRLAELGLYKGKADGRYGTQTRQALIAFQKKNELATSGLPDAPTLLRLLNRPKNGTGSP